MRSDGSVTAGLHLEAQVRRRLSRRGSPANADVLILRCDGHILYRETYTRAQARDLHQFIKAQLKALSLADFVELWNLRDAFDEPNELW